LEAAALFDVLGELVPPAITKLYPWHAGCCILATRVAIEVAAHYGIEARPLPVQVLLYNEAFRRHLEAREELDVHNWYQQDGSHSIGLGFGAPEMGADKWAGHLIVTADGLFADLSIRQAERLERKIVTGGFLVGPYRPGLQAWEAVNDHGTAIQYKTSANMAYTAAPDWCDPKRRRQLAGPIIREVRRRF
jgi:hypothetical protein